MIAVTRGKDGSSIFENGKRFDHSSVDVKVIDTLTAHNVLLVQMTSDVVRLVQGLGITNVEWSTEGNMITKYKVMTIQVPQVRCDYNLKSGVTHLA